MCNFKSLYLQRFHRVHVAYHTSCIVAGVLVFGRLICLLHPPMAILNKPLPYRLHCSSYYAVRPRGHQMVRGCQHSKLRISAALTCTETSPALLSACFSVFENGGCDHPYCSRCPLRLHPGRLQRSERLHLHRRQREEVRP